MCGIIGYIDFKMNTPFEVLNDMVKSLAHRGPDDFGSYYDENKFAQIGFGHTRLSIIDLSPLGHQPMIVDNLIITFNGEIYNFQEIKNVLLKEGVVFNSNSDTEVILKSFLRWGIDCVQQFRGMFSFVIYDKKLNKIWAVRDRVGVKPLYYYFNDGVFLFASELKAFHKHPRFIKQIDLSSLALFMQYSYIPAPYCIFQNTHKLLPGHYIEISLEDQKHKLTKYWDVATCYNQGTLQIAPQDALIETENVLVDSFNLRMVSDVPVGVFLSGGYDSTAVAALLQKDRTEKIKTFTIGFDAKGFDEAPDANKIASYLGTDHTEYYCSPQDALAIIPKLPEIYDEPFADNSTVPTVLVSQLARRGVTVALSGDGGDEIFAGYDKFNRSLKLSNSGRLGNLASDFMGLVNPERIPLLRNSFNFSTRYEKMRLILSSKSPSEILKVISQHIPHTEVRNLIKKDDYLDYKTFFDLDGITNTDPLAKLLAIDYVTFLSDNNLAKMDRATMSVGLEGREPFLDHRVVEYVSRLPSSLKINNGVNKFILKQIVHKYVPENLLDRPKKPFLAPLSIWFEDQLKEFFTHYLDASRIDQEGLLNSEPIIKMRDQFLGGKPIKHQKLWNILIFEMWYERWME
jgi:asparagine synthase (glutamine-hydrolysing)